jgi:CRISPR-associated protein Cmr2
MSSQHCFDWHLGNASGDPADQRRKLGNVLRDDAEATAKEWNQEFTRFLPSEPDLDALPDGSWLLKLTFTLAKPFTSRTEKELHPYEERQDGKTRQWFELQNPIVRDHLTGLAFVKPTTWKGHLRFAARMEGVADNVVTHLFGTARADESGQAGCLRFFPTFFIKDAQREVVTPLKRATRTPARGPIDIEVIPSGSQGTYALLYIPHPKGERWSAMQIADDLEAIARALKLMFLDYGFSAKKTAGWGVIQDKLSDGCLWVRGSVWPGSDERGAKVESVTAFAQLASRLAKGIRSQRAADG